MPASNPYNGVPEAPRDLDIEALAEGREVELEIGFGRGHFILDRAQAHPDRLIIGLELRRKWVGLALNRAERLEIDNVLLRFGDARSLVEAWGPAESLAWVFVNFPDPWWKKRHQKRRVLGAETVANIARLLRPEGKLLVQTDVEERNEIYEKVLAEEPLLVDLGPIVEDPVEQKSHRERKCLEASLPVHRLLFRKSGTTET